MRLRFLDTFEKWASRPSKVHQMEVWKPPLDHMSTLQESASGSAADTITAILSYDRVHFYGNFTAITVEAVEI